MAQFSSVTEKKLKTDGNKRESATSFRCALTIFETKLSWFYT